MSRPLVLLSNDDGYRAAGLEALRGALAAEVDVIVCAPESEQSAASHSLSLHRPLRLTRHAEGLYGVDGTPADCVYVALHAEGRVLPRKPDLVVSGLNHGVNLGDDVFYSGTVAAAREGALRGIPSIAASAAHGTERSAAARAVVRLALALHEHRKHAPLLLNVNFPPGAGWALRATRLGARVYHDSVEFRVDPRGRDYLWIGGNGVSHRPVAGSDTEAYDQGLVGVTPLVLDLWARSGQSELELLISNLEAPG